MYINEMALNNIDITNENTDVFCLKSSQDSSSEEYEKILGKYPYLQVVPTTVFSKYDYLLKNGLLKYKNNNFEYIEIITRCNRKYIFTAQSLSDIKFNQFVVLFTDSDTELGRVTDFLDNIENMNDHRKGIESGVAILRIASDNDLRFFNQKYQDE